MEIKTWWPSRNCAGNLHVTSQQGYLLSVTCSSYCLFLPLNHFWTMALILQVICHDLLHTMHFTCAFPLIWWWSKYCISVQTGCLSCISSTMYLVPFWTLSKQFWTIYKHRCKLGPGQFVTALVFKHMPLSQTSSLLTFKIYCGAELWDKLSIT